MALCANQHSVEVEAVFLTKDARMKSMGAFSTCFEKGKMRPQRDVDGPRSAARASAHRPAPRCTCRCAYGSWTNDRCQGSYRRPRHHSGPCNCMCHGEDFANDDAVEEEASAAPGGATPAEQMQQQEAPAAPGGVWGEHPATAECASSLHDPWHMMHMNDREVKACGMPMPAC